MNNKKSNDLLSLTVFKGGVRNTTQGTIVKPSLREMGSVIEQTASIGTKDGSYFVRGPTKTRNDSSMGPSQLLVIDGDCSLDDPHSAPRLILVREWLEKKHINYVAYTTYSHAEGKNKWRVIIQCLTITKEQLAPTMKQLVANMNSDGIPLKYVTEMGVFSQAWFFARFEEKNKHRFEFHQYHDGDIYTDIVSDDIFTESLPSSANSNENKPNESKVKNGTDVITEVGSEIKLPDQRVAEIQSGSLIHDNQIALAFHFHKKGLSQEMNIVAMQGIMNGCSDEVKKDPRWQKRFNDIERDVKSLAIKDPIEVIDEKDIDKRDLIQESYQDKLADDVMCPYQFVIGRVIRGVNNSRYKPNMMAALATVLLLVSYLAGGRYSGNNKSDRLNVYIFIIGLTGSGKGTMVDPPSELINLIFKDDHVMLERLMQGIAGDIASAEGIEDKLVALGVNPDVLSVIDEGGHKLCSNNQNNALAVKLTGSLLDKWSASHLVLRGRLKANGSADSPTPSICAPFLTLGSTATPKSMTDGIDSTFVTTGFAARVVMLPIDPPAEPIRRTVAELTLKEDDMARLRALPEEIETEHALPHGQAMTRVNNPRRIPHGAEVDDFYFKLATEQDNYPGDSMLKSISNRRVQNVKKLAMICASLEHPRVVTLEIAQWACQIVDYGINYGVWLFKHSVSESPTDAANKAILARLKQSQDNGSKGTPTAVLSNLTPMRKLTPFLQKNVLASLEENGTIIKTETKSLSGRGRPKVTWALVA